MSLTQKELIETIRNDLGVGGTPISLTQVEAVLRYYGTVAARALKEDGEVPLPGLGKLKASQRAARTGRNPATGKPIEIPAKTTAKLVVGKGLDEALNQP
ncbi:HU family DNA-binding protein [Pseudomonas sp. F(2018)]|uniref:HU family DNA-binding protein n=1 Tax=Pseudomonas sp. F(2018) TaxID=2502240 RepID=UPI0010F697B9|nr:HU family DNA-binding protein [Pseudomonas sp. F(2018)]